MRESFEIASGITLGILFPLLVLAIATLCVFLLHIMLIEMKVRLDQQRKTAPFDSVETHMNIQDKSLNVRFIKNKKAIWISTITDKEMQES